MTPVRAIGYVRTAPRERPGQRPGLRAQRDAVAAECERRGWQLVRVEQDVRSGRTLRRRGLRSALESCRAGSADAIVVARLDRLTYALPDLALVLGDALRSGFNVVACDLGVDLSTPSGRHLATVLAAAAEWHPRSVTRRVRTSLAAPTGGRRGRPTSTPPAVGERIRALRGAGWTLQAICDRLNAESVPTARGGSHWRPSSLRAVLRDPAPPAVAKEER